VADTQSQGTSQSSQGTGSQTNAGDSGAQGGASTQTQSSQGGTSQATGSSPQRPDYLPEKFWDAQKGEAKHTDFRADYDRLLASDAATTSRKLTLPANPDAYKADLPKDFKLPVGMEGFGFKTDAPELKMAATFAHEAGLDQGQYSKLLGLYASTVVQAQQAFEQGKAAEIAKLGATGTARIDALHNFIKGAFGEAMAETVFGKQVEGKGGGFGGMLWTAQQVEFLEAMVAKLTSSTSSFSQQHREVQTAPQKLSQEQYDKLSTAEKKAYAAQFDQSQFTRAA